MASSRRSLLALVVLPFVLVSHPTAAPNFSAWSASAQTVTTFSVPGATHTRAFGINPAGEIVGIYIIGTVFRGFELGKDGLSEIDYPGAPVTAPIKINPQGDVVGWYSYTSAPPFHGFLLHDGAYSPVDVPGAVGTQPFGINARGEIVGTYQNADNLFQGSCFAMNIS
jgi:hypothetical protein